MTRQEITRSLERHGLAESWRVEAIEAIGTLTGLNVGRAARLGTLLLVLDPESTPADVREHVLKLVPHVRERASHDSGGLMTVKQCVSKRPRTYLAGHLTIDHNHDDRAIALSDDHLIWLIHRSEHPNGFFPGHSERWIASSTPQDISTSDLLSD